MLNVYKNDGWTMESSLVESRFIWSSDEKVDKNKSAIVKFKFSTWQRLKRVDFSHHIR